MVQQLLHVPAGRSVMLLSGSHASRLVLCTVSRGDGGRMLSEAAIAVNQAMYSIGI